MSADPSKVQLAAEYTKTLAAQQQMMQQFSALQAQFQAQAQTQTQTQPNSHPQLQSQAQFQPQPQTQLATLSQPQPQPQLQTYPSNASASAATATQYNQNPNMYYNTAANSHFNAFPMPIYPGYFPAMNFAYNFSTFAQLSQLSMQMNPFINPQYMQTALPLVSVPSNAVVYTGQFATNAAAATTFPAIVSAENASVTTASATHASAAAHTAADKLAIEKKMRAAKNAAIEFDSLPLPQDSPTLYALPSSSTAAVHSAAAANNASAASATASATASVMASSNTPAYIPPPLYLTCYVGMKCFDANCYAIHGIFEPVQQNYYIMNRKTKTWGKVVCPPDLQAIVEQRSSDCQYGSLCLLRHFDAIRTQSGGLMYRVPANNNESDSRKSQQHSQSVARSPKK